MYFSTPCFLLSLTSLATATTPRGACNADNCLRAITGTHKGPAHLATASADCSAFLKTTITPPPVTVFTTVTATAGIAKRAQATIPAYASPCSGAVRYSSACSCFGITGGTVTGATPTITVTTTTTAPAAPTCTNTQTDPKNCGACGIVCPAGDICSDGACSSSECDGQTCDSGFKNCNDKGSCFCFSSASGVGFCGSNAECTNLTPCATDGDCGENAGSVCAVGTCCTDDFSPLPGVCLMAQCSNPAKRLINASRMKGRGVGKTAAFR